MIKWNYLLQKFVNFWFLRPKKWDHFFKKKCFMYFFFLLTQLTKKIKQIFSTFCQLVCEHLGIWLLSQRVLWLSFLRKLNWLFCWWTQQPGTVIVLSKHQAIGYENFWNNMVLIRVMKTWGIFMSGCQNLKACETWSLKLLSKFSNALIRLLEEWRQHLDNNKAVGGVFMDSSKAYDWIPHDLLKAKLAAYSVDENLLMYIYSDLSNRK